MSNLYIITGPAGVGKSTISRRIAESKNKSALIEGDEIYHQVVGGYVQAWKEGNHLDTFWKICLSSIETYLEDGYDVIFNYIVNPENVELIKNKLKNHTIKFVVLVVDEKTLLLRDKERPEDCQMKERCIVLLNSFKNKNYNAQNILDTTNLSVNETIDIIEMIIDLYYRRVQMDVKLDYSITVDEFLEMVESVGWKTYTREQIEKALQNTMYMVKATVNGKTAGIGRVVGDYSIVCILTDICVKPEFQGQGIGLKITSELKNLIEDNVSDGEKMQIELTPTAGNEPFYEKAGFKYKPDKITGMYLWIKK